MNTDTKNDKERPVPVPPVGQDVQDHLGRKLKASYEDLVRQPVPDKFKQLLDELERRERQQ